MNKYDEDYELALKIQLNELSRQVSEADTMIDTLDGIERKLSDIRVSAGQLIRGTKTLIRTIENSGKLISSPIEILTAENLSKYFENDKQEHLIVRKGNSRYKLVYTDYGVHEHICLIDVNFDKVVKIINIYKHDNRDDDYREFNNLKLEVMKGE